MVIKLFNERAGIMNSYDDTILKQFETEIDTCPLCQSSFAGRQLLLCHLAGTATEVTPSHCI